MYTIQDFPVSLLLLDAKNPRFILPDTGESQDNIRRYLLEQEDAISLAKSIFDFGGLMPGERIVTTIEENRHVVLEGNRRTCACQLLIDRTLIPAGLEDKIPNSSPELVNTLKNVDIDVIPTREEARRFLATRHIERAREWSTIAKMRFCYEDYANGHQISSINQRTGLANASINKYIRYYKILTRGLDSEWAPEEKQQLFILDIKPNNLLRMFELEDTKHSLRLYFDNQHVLKSNLLSDDDISEIIHIWTRKAFIENAMNTRSVFHGIDTNGASIGAKQFIEHILARHSSSSTNPSHNDTISSDADRPTNGTATGSSGGSDRNGGSSSSGTDGTRGNAGSDGTNGSSGATGNGGSTAGGPTTGGSSGGGPNVSRFFGGLNWSNVNESQHNGKGVILVCTEISKITNSSTFINGYPICTAFIIRALIEQSLKYYAKTKGYWSTIMQKHLQENRSAGDPQLSFIINQFKTNLAAWIPDQNTRRLFDVVFTRQVQVDKFNLVVHSPERYTLSPDTLKSIPNEGLLALTNYLLS